MFRTLFLNEWIKFRRRGRVLWTVIGIGVSVGLLSGLSHQFNNPAAARVTHVHYQAGHRDPVTRALNRFSNWEQVYNNAMVRHQQLPSLKRGLALAESWQRAERQHPLPDSAPGVGDATQTVMQLRFAIAHHLEFQPENSTGIMSGARLVHWVFSTTNVLVVALLILFVAGDGLAIETAAGTWNSLWADPVPRRNLILVKLVWMAIVTVAITLVTAGLLWVVGNTLYGSAPLWPIEDIHWTLYLYHPPAGSSTTSPYLIPIIRHLSDLHFQSMTSAAVTDVLFALVPVLSVASVAVLLGYLIPSGLGSGLAALLFTTGPLLATAGPRFGANWLGFIPSLYLPMGEVQSAQSLPFVTWATVGSGVLVGILWAVASWIVIGTRAYRKEW